MFRDMPIGAWIFLDCITLGSRFRSQFSSKVGFRMFEWGVLQNMEAK